MNVALRTGERVVAAAVQPLHAGVGGLIAAADEQTHSALVTVVAEQFALGAGVESRVVR